MRLGSRLAATVGVAALITAASAVNFASAADCGAVMDFTALTRPSLSTCAMEGRTVIVSDLNLTVPPEGQGVGQSVTRTADSDRSLPTQVELLHSVSGGVAVSIDGADPIGEPDAVKEMVAQQEASLARVESGPLAVAAAYPSWCGSSSQYALTGQKWSGKIYQWFTNYSGRPSSMTESARYAAFDAAEGYIEAKNSTCGGSTHSLAVGEVGSTTKAVGVQDGKSTQGWKSLSSGTLALTTWWYAGSSTTEADMAFSTSVSWYAGTGTVPSTKYDLVSIATHEIGHAVGLGHVSSTPKQVMYPYFNLGENRREKRMGDLYGIGFLY